jgi:hypothetical protein
VATQAAGKKIREAWVAAVAMADTPHQEGEMVGVRRTRFQAVAAAKAGAAATPGTPRSAVVREAAKQWSFQAAWAAAMEDEEAAATQLPWYQEAATAAGKSKPCPAALEGTVAESNRPRAVRFPCHCIR